MYRNNWFGGDGWTYYPVTVTIADTCPVCGGSRGVPSINRYCEDEQFYYLSNWKNACGHLDTYKAVYLEAQNFTDGQINLKKLPV
jgi:hypothetical protein